jgi:S1-C subfamily serine protease
MKSTSKLLVFFSVLTIFTFGCQIFSNTNLNGTAQDLAESLTTTPQVATVVVHPQAQDESGAMPLPVSETVPQELLVQLYENVSRGVVTIQVLTQAGGSQGSGFVFDKEGHIITNYHVVEGLDDLEVDFPSGFKTRGKVIAIDTDSDLAVIKVEAPAEELFPLALGDSADLKVGQTVIAIGNPFGLTGTMTTGIISALGRTLDSMRDAPGGSTFTAGDIIQTDTAINPGNSGGPLLNLRGEVVGVNRAIRTFNFTTEEEPLNSGIGFAIAINIVKRVVPVLIEDGEYHYPYIGISSLPDISLLEMEALALPQSTGAYVTSVTEGGPAERAGLRAGTVATDFPLLNSGGDLIIAIDSQPVHTFGDLLAYLINNKNPGEKVVLTILRDDQKMDLELTLDQRP